MASGPEAYAEVEGLIYSPFGAAYFFVMTGIILYHLLNGIRHLAWDAGKGFDPKFSNTLSILIILASAAGAAALTYMLVGSVS